MPEISENIIWTMRVPIFSNSTIMKQLGLAIGIPFGLLILFLFMAKAIYALAVIGVLFLFTYLFILVVWGGKYDVGYKLTNEGIHHFTLKGQAKKNLIANSATAVLGLLSAKPAVAGAGVLAQSRQSIVIKWNSVTKVKFKPKNKTVMIRAGFTENIALFCTPQNYSTVESFIQSRLKGKKCIINKDNGHQS